MTKAEQFALDVTAVPIGAVLGTVEVVAVERSATLVMGYRFAWVLDHSREEQSDAPGR